MSDNYLYGRTIFRASADADSMAAREKAKLSWQLDELAIVTFWRKHHADCLCPDIRKQAKGLIDKWRGLGDLENDDLKNLAQWAKSENFIG